MVNLKKTLGEQIYQIIRKDILMTKIPGGTKLTLQKLKDEFQVSHTPIREALTRLSEDGLVIYYSNIGVSVVELTEEDVLEIFNLSFDLDSLAIIYAMKSPSISILLSKLKKNIEESDALLKAKSFEKWVGISDNFHLLIHEHSNNRRLDEAANKLRSQLTLIYNTYEIESIQCEKIQEYHREIYNCMKENDLDCALEYMRLHKDNDLELVLSIQGLSS